MSRYNKPHLTFKQQLELLKSRGLEVTNDNKALEYLDRLSYYRLSGYWYPCRKLLHSIKQKTKSIRPRRSDKFLPNSRFQDVVELYVFDKKLRLLILDSIERIEVAFRVDIAYLLGENHLLILTQICYMATSLKKLIQKLVKPNIKNGF